MGGGRGTLETEAAVDGRKAARIHMSSDVENQMCATSLGGVDVLSWNPRRVPVPVLRRFNIGKRTNNFGDVSGPQIVALAMRASGIEVHKVDDRANVSPKVRLLGIGSVIHFARSEDVIWGSGVNGKVANQVANPGALDVRALRGPLSSEWLARHWSIHFDGPYGDPFLTLPLLAPKLFDTRAPAKDRDYLIIPNLHDLRSIPRGLPVLSPRLPLEEIIKSVSGVSCVIASSLHGIILGELMNKHVVCYMSRTEPAFKYIDYFEGTGRPCPKFAPDLEAATAERSTNRYSPKEIVDSAVGKRVLDAFPADLWRS